MVRACADMRPHADGGEEIGSSPLDVDTLKCIRIVACPEFVEVGKYAVVDTSAAAGASLYRQLRIAGANASAHVLKTPVVFDVQVALIVFGQVLRTLGDDGHIGVPLDIINVGIGIHQFVHRLYDKILHLRVGEVEHDLCAAAGAYHFPFGCLDNPFGVLFVQFAFGISHFRFQPDAEPYAVFPGVVK